MSRATYESKPELRRPLRIGISGSYGGTNLGDEAILQGIITSLRARAALDVTVFSGNPDDTLRRHQVEHAVDRERMSREEGRAAMERLDLFILGGGGLLFDAVAETYLHQLALAHDLGVPTMTYGISAGPLEQAATRKLVREALNHCAAITVRDRMSRRLLEEIGVEREILVTADPALVLQPEPLDADALRAERIEAQQHVIGFSVREPGPAAPDIDPDEYHALLANAGDYVVERLNAGVVFVSLERSNQDLQHSHAVVSKMQRADHAVVLKQDYTPGQLITLMRRFELAIGMRLHFLIFAALAGVPFVALPYASKVSGFLDDFEFAIPPLDRASAGQLIAHIDRCWDYRQSISAAIHSKLPALRGRADENARIAISLLLDRQRAKSAPP